MTERLDAEELDPRSPMQVDYIRAFAAQPPGRRRDRDRRGPPRTAGSATCTPRPDPGPLTSTWTQVRADPRDSRPARASPRGRAAAGRARRTEDPSSRGPVVLLPHPRRAPAVPRGAGADRPGLGAGVRHARPRADRRAGEAAPLPGHRARAGVRRAPSPTRRPAPATAARRADLHGRHRAAGRTRRTRLAGCTPWLTGVQRPGPVGLRPLGRSGTAGLQKIPPTPGTARSWPGVARCLAPARRSSSTNIFTVAGSALESDLSSGWARRSGSAWTSST